MKLRLPSKLVAAIMAAASPVLFTTIGSATLGETAAATETSTLGNVMYIGDSITNGHQSNGRGMVSWRWPFFKILTDNGISQTEQGINTGRNNGSYHTQEFVNQTYRGATFENIHSGFSSGRAWEISGRTAGGRYDNTNIKNWLGASTVKNGGNGTYSGTVYSAENGNAIDNFFLLIGTNDLLSDAGYSETQFNEKYNNLLGYDAATDTLTHTETADIEVIYNTMKAQAPNANIVMLTIPTTGTNSGNVCTPATVSGIMKYNELLTRWVADKNAAGGNIKLIDVNKGLIDVTDSVPTQTAGANSALVHQSGVAAFFNDGLHPSAQGELIIAGNVAKGMGIGGRTAGLERSAATADGWSHAEQTEYALGGSTLTFAENAFTTANGYTVDFGAVFGNGSAEGWLASSNALTVTIGDGSHTGTLNMSEGYIMWGSDILYSQDNHANADNIRIAYHNGSVAENVAGGYYVWLGDMLIGEGLTATTGSGLLNGITLGATGAAGTVSNLSWADTAYAPTTTGTCNFLASTPASMKNTSQGIKTDVEWTSGSVGYVVPSGTASATTHLSKEITETSGRIYTGGVNANYAGDVDVKYSGTANAEIGALGAFGGTGHVTLDGNLYMEFDSTGTFGQWTSVETNGPASVVGAYNATVNGDVTLVLNNGSFTASIYGGAHTGAYDISGATNVYVNGGTIAGSVFGGGRTGSISKGSAVTVTGGVIKGSVYGGGTGGTISDGTSVTITGGDIRGNVFGGMNNETEGHYTGDVTIESNHASIAGNINANNVTLKDVEDGNYNAGFDRYRGAINATTLLTLDGYTAAHLNAAITTQGVRLTNNSATTISNLTLTACDITAETGSSLTLEGTLTLGNTATYSGDIRIADGITFSMSSDTARTLADGVSATYTSGASGYRTIGTVTLLTPGTETPDSRLTVGNTTTYQGADALAGATFSYNAETGVLSATSTVRNGDTYYVNSAVTYAPDTEAYTADAFVIGNGGNLTLATNLKDGVTVTGTVSTNATITVGDGVTLARPTNSVTDKGNIATYVVNEGGVLDWGTANNEKIYFNNSTGTISGNGLVKIAYSSTTSTAGEFQLGNAFTGVADISGLFNVRPTAINSPNTTFYIHDGETAYASDMNVANTFIFGGQFIMHPGAGSTTLSGILSSKEGDENQNLILGDSNNQNKNFYFTNAGAANIHKVTLAYDNLTLKQDAANAVTDKIFTGNIDVNGGRTLSLVPKAKAGGGTDNHLNKEEAILFDGVVALNGSSSESSATLDVTDGSFYFKGGISVADNGYATFLNQWDKMQHVESLTGHNATLSMSRPSTTWSNTKGGYVILYSEGDFSGTIKLANGANDGVSGLVLNQQAGQALASTVLDFSGSTNKSLVAFLSGDATYNGNNVLTNTTFGNGAVAGLVGEKGSVKASDLAIAASGTHTYSGDLLVDKLTVSGTGSQTLTGSNTLSAGAVVENGATLALGGTTVLGGTVANNGTLNLGGSVQVDASKLWNYEVGAGEGESAYSGTGDYAGSGYLTNAIVYVVKNNGGTVDAAAATFEGKDVTKDENGNVTFTTTDNSTYYVNSSVAYDATMDIATNLHIADGVILTGSTKPGSMKTLIGSGTYTTSLANISSVVSGTNADWTGTVVLDGVNLWNSGTNTNLNSLGNKNSWVKLMGVTQIDYNWGATQKVIDANLILADKDASHPAWLINQGSSGNGAQITYTLTGQIKGDGTIEKAAAWRQSFAFTGDISGWTGALTFSGSANNSPHTVTFSGDATTINAAITRTYTGGQNLNLTLTSPSIMSEAFTINNTVLVNTLTATNQNVVLGRTPVLGANDAKPTFTITGNVTANHLTLAEGMNASVGGTITGTQATTVEQAATLTLTTALNGSTALKAAMTQNFDGKGTLVFSTPESGTNFNAASQFQSGGQAYTQLIDNIIVNGNMGFNNWSNPQRVGGLTIGAGKSLTINGNARVETEFNLQVQGGLTVNGTLYMGHSSSGTAYVNIEDGADVQLKGIAINNSDDKTFTMNGGTLTFTKDGKVFSDTDASNTTTSFAFLGGTLKAAPVSWNFNHAATVGNVTLQAAKDKVLTISGALSDATGKHGAITKTGEGKLVLSGANTYSGDLTISQGTLQVNSNQALGAFNNDASATRKIKVETGATLDINGTGGNDQGTYAVTLTGGTLANGGGAQGWNQRNLVTVLTVEDADSYVDASGNTYGMIGSGWAATTLTLTGHDLIKTGSGTYILNRTTVSGTGSIVAREGTLDFQSNSGHGTLSSNIVMDGGTVAGTAGNAIFLGKAVSVTATKAGSTFSANVDTNGQTLTVGGTEALTLSGVISGNGGVAKTDANAITLSAANTYTGGTSIENGALIVTNSTALSSSVVSFVDRTAEQAPYRVLAFETGATYDSETGTLTGGTRINGTIAGLSGYRGTVVADTLTINVASGSKEFLHRYDSAHMADGQTTDAAVLDVTKLVKTGAGTQVIGGEYTAARGFEEGLVIANGIDVQQGTLHMKTRGTVKSNISVAAGATFKTSDDNGLALTAADAMHYNGKMTLNGTESNTATLHYVDGSTYIENGLYVDGYGKAIMEWDKTQFIGGFYSAGDTPSELTLERASHATQNPYPRYIVVDKSGDFSGTIKLANNANAETFGIIAAGEAAEQSLAGAVLDMTAGTNGALVAFVTTTSTDRPNTTTRIDNLDTYKGDYLTAANLRDGAVAGLKGTAGNVYAKNLTINTANETSYDFGGSLNVSGLVKAGNGTQTLSKENVTLGTLTMQEGTLNLTNGATLTGLTMSGNTTVTNGGTLNLSGAGVLTDMTSSGATDGFSDGANGFTAHFTSYDVITNTGSGTVNSTVTDWTVNGESVTATMNANGQLAVMTSKATDGIYHVNTAMTYSSALATTDMGSATTFDVKTGVVMTAAGNLINGRAVNLADGATLKALAAGYNYANTQVGSLTLTGDTGIVDVSDSNIALRGSGNGYPSTLNLDGHKLVVKGGNRLGLFNTTTDHTGTISVTNLQNTSTVQIGYGTSKNSTVDASGTLFEFAGGQLAFAGGAEATFKGLTMATEDTTGYIIGADNGTGATLKLSLGGGEYTYHGSLTAPGLNIGTTGAGTQNFELTNNSVSLGTVTAGAEGNLNFSADSEATVNIGAIALANGNVELAGGNYVLGGTENTQGLFQGNGKLTVKDGADVTLNTKLSRSNEHWQFQLKAGENKGVAVEHGSSFTVDIHHASAAVPADTTANLKVTALDADHTATITASADTSYHYHMTNDAAPDKITIADANVEFSKETAEGAEFDNELKNSTFTNKGTTEIALTHTASTLVGVHAENGNVVVKNAGSSKDSLDSIKATGADVTLESLGASTSLNLTELVIGDSQKVTALAGTKAHVDDSNTDVATIAIAGEGSKLTAGVGAKLNANLTMGDGSTLEVQKGGLELGCSLTLSAGENLVLHGATMTEDTHYLNIYDLYTGVDSFILNGEIKAEGWYSAEGIISSITAYATADNSNQLALADGSSYVIGFWHGTVSIAEVHVPEPSTSVLSLLALAGMAARRRRK